MFLLLEISVDGRRSVSELKPRRPPQGSSVQFNSSRCQVLFVFPPRPEQRGSSTLAGRSSILGLVAPPSWRSLRI